MLHYWLQVYFASWDNGIHSRFVMTLQSEPTMEEFGAASLVPGMVAISIIREIVGAGYIALYVQEKYLPALVQN